MSRAIAERLTAVRARIRGAAERVGRDPATVRLIAVSKGVALSAIREAAGEEVRDFGENRVQEAKSKMDALQAASPESPAPWVWHLIGRLQTNKARAAVGRFALIHALDSRRLAAAIDEAASRMSIRQRVLVQVNLGGEPQKGGVTPEELPALLHDLRAYRHVQVDGLMTIPPPGPDPEASRPYFRALRRCGTDAETQVPDVTLADYSMGMSGDFEVAIAEGATMIRVGTAIFGPRPAG
ncbi:MAG: YggS family pyridoxal phosphate-dependent enzyme [Nitrospiria bacterium]